MHALICDDDEFVLRTLTHVLKRMGYHVTSVQNAADAMNVLRGTPIRLVVTDWQMPGMTGIDFCRAVRAEDLDGYVYVVMLTAQDTAEQRKAARAAGVDDFLSKPFDREELTACLKTAERILSLETRDVAMFALAKLAESRDVDTASHIERVQCYARVLAKQLAKTDKYAAVIDAEFVRLIYQTSPLHDIGKVGIPDAILLKAGKLDPAEYEAMKTHVLIGARTLDAALQRFPSARFLRMAHDIAASHHERYNGRGYPAALAGEQIPLSGRIVALADVYDAMTSRRVYKSAMDHGEARDVILRERGEHFDPDVVDAFVATEGQFQDIHHRLSEAAASPAAAVLPPTPVRAQRPEVMVVDDDAVTRRVLHRTLAADGYTVLQAADAEAAIAMARQQRPMVVVADWGLVGMNGTDLCVRLREQAGDAALHLLMLTSRTEKDHVLAAFDAGVNDYLTKPFDPRELAARVRAGLRAVQTQEQLKLRTEASLRLNDQLTQLNAQLEKLAITDDLTRLYNRRQAMTRLDEQWQLAERYGTPMTVMMADVDRFKAINDAFGHEAGDVVLKAVATILKDEARQTDVVCRIGGEEFLVLFPTETPEQVRAYAERCRRAVQARPLVAFGTPIAATLSIGIATRGDGVDSSTALLRAADAALYAAKSGGRNQVRTHPTPAVRTAA